MARKDVSSFKVANAIAGKLEALIKRAGLNSSTNQMVEQLLSECCEQIENAEGAGVLPSIRDIRVRIGLPNPVISLDEIKREYVQLGAKLTEAVSRYEASPKNKSR